MAPIASKQRTKNKYRAAAKAVQVGGPGVWVTCPMGKEKQVIGELYDVFGSIAEELWPESDAPAAGSGAIDSDEENNEEDLETQLKKELSAMKKPDNKRQGKRLQNIHIDTKCLAFLACRSPIDPVRLVHTYFEEIERTRQARTRNVLRLTPVSGTCPVHIVEMITLTKKLIEPVFPQTPTKPIRYRLLTRIRNNNKIHSDEIVPELAKSFPEGHIVDLQNPEVVVMVEVYMAVCGISVVTDWVKYKRFNVVEYAQSFHKEPAKSEDDKVAESKPGVDDAVSTPLAAVPANP